MIKKSFLLGSLAIFSVVAAIRTLFAKSASAKSVSTSVSRDAVLFDELDAYVEKRRRRLNIPGVSMVIVEGDQIVHEQGYGRTRPHGEAPTPQTPFFIGSLTKSFTALAVMQLVEAGKIEFDHLPFDIRDGIGKMMKSLAVFSQIPNRPAHRNHFPTNF